MEDHLLKNSNYIYVKMQLAVWWTACYLCLKIIKKDTQREKNLDLNP